MNCENLIELRTAKGMTQKELAEHVGVSHVMISYYENGWKEPSISVLRRLTEVLGCTSDALIRK